MKKLLALLTAAVATLTSAWAATPVAVWDRDFSTTEKNGYTFAANGNTVGPDGSTLIINRDADTTKAATITWETAFKPITVIVRHNGLPTYSGLMTLATVKVGDQMNQAGVCLDGSDYHTVGYWTGSARGRETGENANSAAGCYVLNYNPIDNNGFPKGTNLKTLINGEVASVHAEPGCVGTGNTMTGVCIGGNGVNKNSNYTGLEITGVAIFNANLTDEEIAAYEWPSDKIYKRYEANFTNRIMTWTTAAASASTSVDLGGASTFIGSKASYQGNQNTTALPGCTTSTLAWRGFCNGQTGYNAPGLVLHMPPYTEGKTVKVGGTFSPFSLGGLIVDEGASSGDTWAALEQTTGSRTTALGDPRTSGGVPSFFTINDNFQIKRNDGDVTFYGDVTLDIADGKVFDCNTTYENYSANLNADAATTLHLVGGGKIKVTNLWVDRAVTLDYSAVSLDRTEAYIDGNLKVNDSTMFILPDGISAEKPLLLCSGNVDGLSSGDRFVKKADGSLTVCNLVVEGNKIVSAEESTDVNPAKGKFCLYDWTFNGTLTSKGLYTNTLSWDTGYSADNGFLTDDTFTYGTALNACATPYVHASAWSITYPTEWTCFVAGVAPSNVNGGLIVFGTTWNGAIGLVTTAEDEVSLVRTTGNSAYQVLAKMTVPGAQTTSHAYTFVKTASAITVYLDGNLWNQTAVPNATFGNKLQVGSIHGGTENTGIVKATSGSIQAVRIMEGVQPAATIRAFSNEFPYHSPNGTYARTFEAGEQSWNAEEAWTSTKDEGNVAEPGAGLVQANFSGETTVSVNLAEDVTYESLTINNNESGSVTFVAAKGSAGSIKAAQMNVNAPVVLGEGAVDLAQGPVTIGEEGSITFDFSGLPYAGAVAAYPFVEKVTGVVAQNDAKFILKAPAENDDFSLAIRYNEGNRYYEVAATYKKLVDVTIPEITGATASVSLGEKTVEIVEGKVTIPATANLTVTYTAITGYTMGATTVATVENVQEGSAVDVTGITATINMYTVQVMHVENATTYVSIGGGEFEVVTEASIQVEHGKSYSAKYVANEGYMLVLPEGDTEPFKTEGYNYGSVTFNTADYPVHCAAVKIAAMIGETPYDSVQAAIDALVDGETTLADITVVDKTATLPEGYEDYMIDEDGKIVLAKTYVAQIGETKYETIAEAIAQGGTITLLADIELTGATDAVVIPATFKGTIDFGTHTISRTANSYYVMDIVAGADVTLKGTTGGMKGTPVASGNTKNPASLIRNKGNLTILSGVYTSDYTVVKNDEDPGKGVLVIDGGTLEIIPNEKGYTGLTFAIMNWTDATINGGTFNGNVQALSYNGNSVCKASTLTINGGTFVVPPTVYMIAYDEVQTPTITVNEGVEIAVVNASSEALDLEVKQNGNVYTLGAKVTGPTGWEDVKEGDDVTTIITLPEGQEETAITATELKAWAEKTGATFGETIPVNALIFNVAPSAAPDTEAAAEEAAAEVLEEVIEAEELDLAALLAKAVEAGEGGLTITSLSEKYPMATIKLVESKKISSDNGKFFQLSIELK